MCALICTLRLLILELYSFVVVSVFIFFDIPIWRGYSIRLLETSRKETVIENKISSVLWDFFQVSVYLYLSVPEMFSCEIRCSDYFCFSFCFKSCLDRKLQVMCLDLFSSRLQSQRTGLPLVLLLEVSVGWGKEYSSSLFGFFLLLLFFPFFLPFTLVWKASQSFP